MSEPTGQQPSPTKRARSARGTKNTAEKHVEQATLDNKTAVQPVVPAEVSSQAETSEPPVGEKWGEFPSAERQAELKRMLETWDQDHGDRTGPFAYFKLTGADVYWLHVLNFWNTSPLSPIFHNPGDIAFYLLDNANLSGARLEGANLYRAHLAGTKLEDAHLEGADLREAELRDAWLRRTHLEGANLGYVHLHRADLEEAHLEGANLRGAQLEGADLSGALLDVKTKLAAHFDSSVLVADVNWNGAPLMQVEWGQVPYLGDEEKARKQRWPNWFRRMLRISQAVYQQSLDAKRSGRPLDRPAQGQLIGNLNQQFQYEANAYVFYYLQATRANRQLAVALQEQGLVEEADRFQYRAQNLQREVFLRQRKIAKYLFSGFLALLTGYGFRMWRIIIAYLALILTFAGAYYGVGFQHPGDISFWQALIVSVTAFHGRVFTNPFTPNIPDAQVIITAIEAVVGLIIEGVFIAMLTQRFFNR